MMIFITHCQIFQTSKQKYKSDIFFESEYTIRTRVKKMYIELDSIEHGMLVTELMEWGITKSRGW